MALSKLTVDRGTTYVITLSYQVNGVAATLVGATVRFTVKASEYDTDDTDAAAVIKKNVTTGNAAGVAVITINPADTQDVLPKTYWYDIKVQDASGKIYKVNEGHLVLGGSPTNRLV